MTPLYIGWRVESIQTSDNKKRGESIGARVPLLRRRIPDATGEDKSTVMAKDGGADGGRRPRFWDAQVGFRLRGC